jgi:arylsulfatase A-like enzyme
LLRRAGYETCVLTENPHTPPETVPRAAYSFLEPVHLNVELGERPLKWRELPDVTRKDASAFLEKHRDRPFFLYIHTLELHDVREGDPSSSKFSYDPPEPYRGMFTSPEGQTPMDQYDATVAFADANFKKVMDRLDELGLAENTVVIVTADHGEDFGEHENHYTHHGKPYNTLTHVPLLIRWPGTIPAGRVVDDNVSLLDLAPTILDVAGLAPFDPFQGLNLVPLIRGRSEAAFNDRLVVSKWFDTIGAVKGDWKLFYCVQDGSARLYNLATDFGETTDAAARNPALFDLLKSELQAHIERQRALHDALAKPEGKPALKIDPQLEEQLRDLGYLEK